MGGRIYNDYHANYWTHFAAVCVENSKCTWNTNVLSKIYITHTNSYMTWNTYHINIYSFYVRHTRTLMGWPLIKFKEKKFLAVQHMYLAVSFKKWSFTCDKWTSKPMKYVKQETTHLESVWTTMVYTFPILLFLTVFSTNEPIIWSHTPQYVQIYLHEYKRLHSKKNPKFHCH